MRTNGKRFTPGFAVWMLCICLWAALLVGHTALAEEDLIPPTASLPSSASFTLEEGKSFMITVTTSNPYEAEPSFRWYYGESGDFAEMQELPGETQAFLQPEFDKGAGLYYYICEVSITVEGTTVSACSNPIEVTVNAPVHPLELPNISLPESGDWVIGSSPALRLVCRLLNDPAVYADATVAYQWYEGQSESFEDATLLDGQTASELSPTPESAGTYYYFCHVTVSRDGSTVSCWSDPVTVTVHESDEPVTPPEEEEKAISLELLTMPDQTIYQTGDRLQLAGLRFRVTTNKGNVFTLEGKSDQLSYSPMRLEDAGEQRITVSYQGVTTRFTVTVIKADKPAAALPVITGQPEDRTCRPNEGVTLRVLAGVSDGGSLSYQWYRATTPSAQDMEAIEGATDAEYTVTAAADGVCYYCVGIKNTLGDRTSDQVLSRFVKLTVTGGEAPDPSEDPSDPTEMPRELHCVEGGELAMIRAASTSAKSFRWYLQKAGEATAVQLSDGMYGAAGTATAILSLEPVIELNGSLIYCQVTDQDGSVRTEARTLLQVQPAADQAPTDPADPTAERRAPVIVILLLAMCTVALGAAITVIIIRKKRMM